MKTSYPISNRSHNQQMAVDHLIAILAEYKITYDEAPTVLDYVNEELNNLCKQQTIQVPSN